MIPWDKEEISIFEEFNYKCARSGHKAIVLHEIVPKSKRPKTWKNRDNRIPLCADCHEWAHSRGTKASRHELTELRHHSKYRRYSS